MPFTGFQQPYTYTKQLLKKLLYYSLWHFDFKYKNVSSFITVRTGETFWQVNAGTRKFNF